MTNRIRRNIPAVLGILLLLLFACIAQAKETETTNLKPNHDSQTEQPKTDPNSKNPDSQQTLQEAAQNKESQQEEFIPVQAPPWELVERTKQAYEYGDYKTAIQLAKSALMHDLLPEQEKEMLMLLGLCQYLQKQYSKAKQTFEQLLLKDPDYKLDPLYVPPQIIDFFDDLRKQMEPQLRPIRERIARQKREQERKKPKKAIEVKVVRNMRALNFLPFGVGQFQNHQYIKGYIILGAEAAALVLNIASYITVKALAGADGKYTEEDARMAKAFQIVQYSAAATFAALWIYGTVDGLIYFVPEFRTPPKEIILPPESLDKQSPPKSSAGFGLGLNLRIRF